MSDKAPDENRPDPSGNLPPTPPVQPTPPFPPVPGDQPPTSHQSPPPHGYYQLPPGQDPWQAAQDPHQPPPGYDPSAYGYGAPGYGTPGYGPPENTAPYGPPGYGAPYYGPPGYQLPSGYYAGPADPLVSADFGGWWQRSFTLLAAVWRPMAQVQLVWAIPLIVVGVLTAIYAPDRAVTFDSTTPPNFSDIFEPLFVVLPFALAAVLLTLVAQLATLDVLVQRATGRPVSVSRALLTGLRRFPAMLGWQLLAGLVILVGLLLCVLPGLYVLIVFLILPVIVLVERGQGIGRAFQLVHASFGAAVARLATIVGLHIAFVLVESVLSAILNPAAGSGPGVTVASAILSAGFSAATGVVMSPLLLTAYADMRARHEPFSTAYLIPHPGSN
uniref:sulfur globule family protein n=1 Tax=Paractinoplanes polyasparticus TaxID=2856853 RepID=UPI001C860C60|nr:sulfur globule family protein [Actinoplanes polyasparticus]